MNIDQWILCISEAYKEAGETFSPAKKEILLGELPQDSPNTEPNYKIGYMGKCKKIDRFYT